MAVVVVMEYTSLFMIFSFLNPSIHGVGWPINFFFKQFRAVSETLMAEGVADEVTGTRVEELLQVIVIIIIIVISIIFSSNIIIDYHYHYY